MGFFIIVNVIVIRLISNPKSFIFTTYFYSHTLPTLSFDPEGHKEL